MKFLHRLVSYLVLLLEPIALASLHLGDMLQQVSHPDGRLELVPGIAHLHGVAGPVGVSLDREGGLGQLPTATICFKEKEAKHTSPVRVSSSVLPAPPQDSSDQEAAGRRETHCFPRMAVLVD